MSRKVLIVDDDEATATVVRMQLERRGLSVDVALGGREALQKLCAMTTQGKEYAVMLLDIAMPDLNGWDVMRAVKANPLWEEIRIVVLTGYATSADDMALVANYDGVHVEKKQDFVAVVGELAERLMGKGDDG